MARWEYNFVLGDLDWHANNKNHNKGTVLPYLKSKGYLCNILANCVYRQRGARIPVWEFVNKAFFLDVVLNSSVIQVPFTRDAKILKSNLSSYVAIASCRRAAYRRTHELIYLRPFRFAWVSFSLATLLKRFNCKNTCWWQAVLHLRVFQRDAKELKAKGMRALFGFSAIRLSISCS